MCYFASDGQNSDYRAKGGTHILCKSLFIVACVITSKFKFDCRVCPDYGSDREV